MPPSIEQLAAEARSGDRGAFADLVEQTLPMVRRFLFRLGAPVQDLDDLAQEVFVTVIEKLDQFQGASRFTTWQLGVAMNTYRSSRRRRPANREDFLGAGPAELGKLNTDSGDRDDPARRVSGKEDVERMWTALACLPEALREVFVLRYVEEISAVEVSSILDLPQGTVRRRAKDARDRLRGALGSNARHLRVPRRC